jgi:hypothetical protein
MTDTVREDSIADELEETRWDYSQRDDRRFLLAPIGEVFATFRWDGRPTPPAPVRSRQGNPRED